MKSKKQRRSKLNLIEGTLNVALQELCDLNGKGAKQNLEALGIAKRACKVTSKQISGYSSRIMQEVRRLRKEKCL